MRLYNNNHTPAEADVLGTYTQASAAGYTAVQLPGTGWTVSTSLGTTTGEHAEQTFSFTTSATIYGYYVTDDAATGLLWSERLNVSRFKIGQKRGKLRCQSRVKLIRV